MSTVNKAGKPNKSHTIEVKLTVPTIGWLERAVKSILRFYKKRWVRILSLALVIILSAAIATLLLLKNIDVDTPSDTSPLVSEEDIEAEVPYYATLLPAEKNIEQLGGWTRVSPADRNAAFAYDDTIGTNRIVVSQQPLPQDFKDDVEFKVAELAKGYKATEKLTIKNVTVHVASSAKGPQAVIFSKDDLLILIRSSVKIPNDSWTQYISSLR